ncbi:MAG: dienelactone hydrolase family protein [bacterium]|jgi:dienelactone hydrolase
MVKVIVMTLLILGWGIGTFSGAAVKTETVEYKEGNTVLEGFLAYDDASSNSRPGVLIVHEWMGINDYTKRRAVMLAEMGYVAFAADIFGKGVRPASVQEASEQAAKYKGDRPMLRARALAGLEQLKKHHLVDPKKIAAIGYCFGGTTALELARAGADIAGVVSFHGGLDMPNPNDTKNVKAKILICHGGDDPYVPTEQVADFQNQLRQAKVDWQFIAYGGAVHSFTNPDAGNDPSKGAAYNADADRRSWEAMKQFFAEIFK